jgi:hypothetical protein
MIEVTTVSTREIQSETLRSKRVWSVDRRQQDSSRPGGTTILCSAPAHGRLALTMLQALGYFYWFEMCVTRWRAW